LHHNVGYRLSMSTVPASELKKATPPQKLPKRPHRIGRWRAGVLIGVHVLIALHILHWKLSGTTITPVEPSEAMQTLEGGLINAGFVLFTLLILSTLILGRWFCGWGCHLVALQDLCSSLLKRMGIRPKPIRSRLLMWVPLFAAVHMFIWPSIVRLSAGQPSPKWVAHFTTSDFWVTFPNLPISLLTFGVCGFLIVYLLGNKGFCTYGCPYGGFFAVSEKVAPGRIRVTDACNGCGQCTAVCTSNVRVHEEVAKHRMVVDAGCMKCYDCVSSCPTGALYYGFGKGAVGIASTAKTKLYDFTWPEELAMAGLFIFGVYSLRGLYEAIPFLLTLGLSVIFAVTLTTVARLFYERNLRFQRFQLKSGGILKPAGMAFLGIGVALVAFLGHSAWIQYHVKEGTRLLKQAQDLYVRQGGQASAELDALTKSADAHWGLVTQRAAYPVALYHANAASTAQFLGRTAEAIAAFERSTELDPNRVIDKLSLAKLYSETGENTKSLAMYREVSAKKPEMMAGQWANYARLLVADNELDAAISAYEKAAAETSGVGKAGIQSSLALLWAQKGEFERALPLSREAALTDRDGIETQINHGLIVAASGNLKTAETHFLSLKPRFADREVLWTSLLKVQFDLGKLEAALQSARESLRAVPDSELLPSAFAQLAIAANKRNQEMAALVKIPEPTPAQRSAIAQLKSASGGNQQ
jgi:tetratricopeptide (TPR) repeat protein/ferredoxin